MLFQSGKFLVDCFGCAAIRCIRFFGAIKNSEILRFALVPYSRSPFAYLAVLRNTLKSSAIIAKCFLVSHILASRRKAQIAPAIVVFTRVPMIYLAVWPFSNLYQPDEAGCFVEYIVYFDLDVSRFVCGTSNLARQSLIHGRPYVWTMFPDQLPGLWSIAKKRPHVFSREVVAVLALLWNAFVSHSIVPQSLWSGAVRGVGSATSAPNHYQFVGSS